jgi:hypothetical protein
LLPLSSAGQTLQRDGLPDALDDLFFWWEDAEALPPKPPCPNPKACDMPANAEARNTAAPKDARPGDAADAEPTDAKPQEGKRQKTALADKFTPPTTATETAAGTFFTTNGPAREITAKPKRDKDVEQLLKRLLESEADGETRRGLHPRKAFTALLFAPHTVMEKKQVHRGPSEKSLYVVVDQLCNYYKDDGALLEAFARTAQLMGAKVWRNRKLLGPSTHEGKSYKPKSLMHWAELAQVPQGSTVVFVGDGCRGGSEVGWKQEDVDALAKHCKPVWFNNFEKGKTCGCAPKTLAAKGGWEMYHGVASLADLKDVRIKRNRKHD